MHLIIGMEQLHVWTDDGYPDIQAFSKGSILLVKLAILLSALQHHAIATDEFAVQSTSVDQE